MLLSERIGAEFATAAGADIVDVTAVMVAFSPCLPAETDCSSGGKQGMRVPGYARPSSLCIRPPAVPFPRTARESAYDDLSQGSVRLGQPVLAFTYSSAVLLISGRTLSLIGWIEGTTVFHFVPSHWTREMPL